MASGNYSGLLLSVLIILLAFSRAKCYEGKNKPADIQNSGNKNAVPNHDNHTTKENDETKTFLEAADEVANLMRKDYRRAPRRKPPINNHQPKN
ncbi:hypothetical protein DH2020_037145 [Rehmannia glutinosa]|uniref:Uncharacterized protein n=1 Tax=Rehmannia glutinosa TaxID=99300 RepID=A0ABR0V3S8_REHGL